MEKDREQTIGSRTGGEEMITPQLNPDGWINLDVRMDSTVESRAVRQGIRDAFFKAVGALTGLTTIDKHAKLVKYLNTCLAKVRPMPSHGEDMLASLKDTYLNEIGRKCNDIDGRPDDSDLPLISSLIPVPLAGHDFYCIGEGGKRFCYHFFGLTEEFGTGGLYSVKFDAESCPVCLVCVGPADGN